jgi:hypothetical protein
VILRCFHQSVPRCSSRLQEQREPAKCKCWQREQRNGAGLLVKCLPTARSLPAPPRRFQHVPLQGQLARLYNLSRRFEAVSLSSMDLRRLRLMGVGGALGANARISPIVTQMVSAERAAALRNKCLNLAKTCRSGSGPASERTSQSPTVGHPRTVSSNPFRSPQISPRRTWMDRRS